MEAVDLRGAHDFRRTFATWLEDDGVPARVIDELMGHEPSTRGAQHLGSAMGVHYRHTTPEMAARVVTAIQTRLTVVVHTAEETVEAHPTVGVTMRVLTTTKSVFWQISGKRRSRALRAWKRPDSGPA